VVPVVSNVSSIKHYVNEKNGFVWDINEVGKYTETLSLALYDSSLGLQSKSENILKLARNFTFENYYKQLTEKILDVN
ncbi:MAG: hypothetical protein ACK4FS_11295, partial [Flavobacterium sp.]